MLWQLGFFKPILVTETYLLTVPVRLESTSKVPIKSVDLFAPWVDAIVADSRLFLCLLLHYFSPIRSQRDGIILDYDRSMRALSLDGTIFSSSSSKTSRDYYIWVFIFICIAYVKYDPLLALSSVLRVWKFLARVGP
jgi:hypothetical protein